MTPPETSSLLSIHQSGRLSRAHVERFASELARRHGATAGTGAVSDVTSAMLELELLGERVLSNLFLAAWLEETGNFHLLGSLRTSLAREAQPPRAGALIITHGLSGAGKTTVAIALAGAIGAVMVRNDVELVRMVRERSSGAGESDPGQPRLRDRLELLAVQVIEAGWPVIVESCFLGRADRQHFRARAAELGVPFAILECSAPLSIIRERLDKRRALAALFHGEEAGAGAVLQRLEAQLDRTDALDDLERAETVTVDTSAPVDVQRLAPLILERIQSGRPPCATIDSASNA